MTNHEIRPLCSAILLQSVKDWKALCKLEKEFAKSGMDEKEFCLFTKRMQRCGCQTFSSLMAFYNSPYGQTMMEFCELDIPLVKRTLEDEKRKAEKFCHKYGKKLMFE